MPKIFVLRHQLAEQQAKLKLQAKGSDPAGSVSPSSDEEKFDPQPSSGQVTCIVNPSSPPQIVRAVEQPLELINKQQKITGRPSTIKVLSQQRPKGQGSRAATHKGLNSTANLSVLVMNRVLLME